jgi:phosphatidyl-myo-inositol dimannoside synthase
MPEPRALILTPDYPPAIGGIQLLVRRLVSNLERVRPDVLALRAPSPSPPESDGDEAPVRRLPRPPLGGQRSAVAGLNAAGVLRGLLRPPDVILCAHIVCAPAATALRRAVGVPYVQMLYGNEVAGRPGLAARAVAEASAVVAISRHTRELALGAGADPGRVHLVAPGVDPAPGRPARRGGGRPIVVCVSRIDDPYKGHDVLLRAMPLVTSRVARARLALVGDGTLRPMHERLAESLSLDGSIEFTGSLDDRGRERWLRRASVFAMPSRVPAAGGGEGFGIVYLEAGARSLPVVAGAEGGALDSVVDGETGLLVDPRDHVAVADAIVSLLLDPARARAMGTAGAKRAQGFTWDRMAAGIEELLLEACDG